MDASRNPAPHAAEGTGLRIDIGCGGAKREGFIGFDCLDIPGVDHILDLTTDIWPLDDNSVDYVFSSHFVEHIYPPIHVFQEIGRVCREGATIEIWTPYAFSNEAFLYTHVAFLTEEIWYHFCCHYPDVHAPSLNGRWLLRNIHYVVPAAVEQDLAARGFSVDFGVRYLKSIVKEFCVEIEYRHDLTLPASAPTRTYSHLRHSQRFSLDVGQEAVQGVPAGSPLVATDEDLRRENARLHTIVAQKDAHITRLEGLIRRIERGRLMRLLNVFSRA